MALPEEGVGSSDYRIPKGCPYSVKPEEDMDGKEAQCVMFYVRIFSLFSIFCIRSEGNSNSICSLEY
jgi:hypothetical protein